MRKKLLILLVMFLSLALIFTLTSCLGEKNNVSNDNTDDSVGNGNGDDNDGKDNDADNSQGDSTLGNDGNADEEKTENNEGGESEQFSKGLEYELNDTADSYSVDGIGTCADTDVVIPDMYDGLPVTRIGYQAFKGCSGIKSVILPNTINSIDMYAFEDCVNLINIVLPDGVKKIESHAFRDCNSLTSIIIPDSVEYIGNGAFKSCFSLVDVVISNGVDDISEGAFSRCYSLTKIVVPEGVVRIGDNAFEECYHLTSVSIPSSVVSIGESAFNFCEKLVEVINFSSLNITAGESGNGGVSYYAKVVHATKSLIVNTDDYLFFTHKGVNYLLGYVGEDTDLKLPKNYNDEAYEIYPYAFYCRTDITSVEIPNSLTSVGYHAFYECTGLVGVYTNDLLSWCSISFAGSNPLSYAKKLYIGEELITEVVIPDEVTEIDYNTFSNCENITSIVLGDNVTDIKGGAFAGCVNLEKIIIPDSVTKIEYSAFSGCSNLVNIIIPDSVNYIGDSAFKDCFSLTSIVIPNGVSEIRELTFYGCNNLVSVTIGSSVKSIDYFAFNDCFKLAEVVNKSSLDIIAGSNNYGNVALYAKEVHSEDSKVVNDNGYLFYTVNGVNYLLGYIGEDTYLRLPENYNGENYEIIQYAFYKRIDITCVIVSDGVTSIGEGSFKNCSGLQNIVIGTGIVSVGREAFSWCPELTTVYYKGSAKDWNKISIDHQNNYLENANRYYYSEEKPEVPYKDWHYVDGEVVVW